MLQLSNARDLETNEFLSFLKTAPVCIVKVGHFSNARLGDEVQIFFSKLYENDVAFGYLAHHKINMKDLITSLYVKIQQQKLNLPKSDSVHGGYYLFIYERIVAYSPDDIDFNNDGLPMALNGILNLFFEKKSLLNSLSLAVNTGKRKAAQRVIQFFQDIINKTLEEEKQQFQNFLEEVQADELSKAYDFMGLNNNCTNNEIKSRFRYLAKKYHPDKNPDNLKEAEEKIIHLQQAHKIILDGRENNLNNVRKP